MPEEEVATVILFRPTGPEEDLEELNQNIVGLIEVVREFR